LDFWQGHWSNILGHNPEPIARALSDALAGGFGLQTGHTDRLQIEVAEILCRRTGAERVRFTTSGTLATMYAILLARAFTGRDLVLKVGGGWHGSQPWALKGVHFTPGDAFDAMDSAGLSSDMTDQTLVTSFNDPDMLRDRFRRYGDRIACFIVEPCIGSGGGMLGAKAYLEAARELTAKYGAVLIFDEVISGFRFRAGDAAALAGVRPDLSTFGKAISGGAPVAAVAGRADILRLAGREGGNRVNFSGGTFSGHPLCMLAAKTMMNYLVEHEAEIYPYLTALAESARSRIEAAFAQHGIFAQCVGRGTDALPPISMIRVHFPYEEGRTISRPEEALDPSVCDVTLGEKVIRLAMLLENVNAMFGFGVISAAHTEADLDFAISALGRVARRIRASYG
jgi:glutamate-1-semialdehyde 2,1-aminomutase